jgi:hypothetical protein
MCLAQTVVISNTYLKSTNLYIFCYYVAWKIYCSFEILWFFSVDNGTREGLDKFLNAASSDPETVLHYEFMQDYKVGH